MDYYRLIQVFASKQSFVKSLFATEYRVQAIKPSYTCVSLGVSVYCFDRTTANRTHIYISLVMRKPAFCMCENKDAHQLRSNCATDQCYCFRYTDSTTPSLPRPEITGLLLSSVVVQTGLCRTWSKTPNTGFLTTRLNLHTRLSTLYVFLRATPSLQGETSA